MTLTSEHEAYMERTRHIAVGEVIRLGEEWTQDNDGRLFMRRVVRVGDESDSDPDRRLKFLGIGATGEEMLADPANSHWKKTQIIETEEDGKRVKKVIVDPNNIPAKLLYYEIQDGIWIEGQMMDWAKDFPTAIALEPLQRLDQGGRMLTAGRLDQRTHELFTFMTDAIGIRSRARIYAERLAELAQGSDVLKVISVGCGAAVPNIEATKKLEAQGTAAHWKFFDNDPRALEFAHELISESNFEYSTVDYGPLNRKHTVARPWQFEGRSYAAAFKEADESTDIIDAIGLWEYLPHDSAVKFAQRLHTKLKKGGTMIVSNMLDDRPELLYNQSAVGWPKLHLRSETELLEILEKAGIASENVTMTHAQDGVYVVMEIHKP